MMAIDIDDEQLLVLALTRLLGGVVEQRRRVELRYGHALEVTGG